MVKYKETKCPVCGCDVLVLVVDNERVSGWFFLGLIFCGIVIAGAVILMFT